MHLALASRDDIPAFAPEPITPHYQRSIYQHIRSQAVQTFQLLRRRGKGNPAAEELLAREEELQQRIRRILDGRIAGHRIRIHGDYHLGQVLHTGNDFVIIDFEGRAGAAAQRASHQTSALRDVAGMLRSFHYAPYAVAVRSVAALRHPRRGCAGARERRAVLVPVGEQPRSCAHISTRARRDRICRRRPRRSQVLLDAHLLEKALYEIAYELNNRPDWVRIPIRGVLDLL